jgi:hypothetical protein
VDIMEKQAGSVAGRPRLVAAGEILNGGMSLGFISTGDRLRRMRRFVVCDAALISYSRYNVMQSTSHTSAA